MARLGVSEWVNGCLVGLSLHCVSLICDLFIILIPDIPLLRFVCCVDMWLTFVEYQLLVNGV